MSVPLHQILALVGRLDDTPGEDTPRERFRRFLQDNVQTVAVARDYLEECLRESGEQYSRALQDLANRLGHFLGFKVTFGRYQGAQGAIGFDGIWSSPRNFHIVVEVKTTEVYPIKAATLVSYIDELISEKRIPNWEHALGLYVIGRPDSEIQQLHNAIVAERRTHQLRTISVDSLLTLAELVNAFDVSHDEILALLKPSGPKIDPLVDLIARLAALSGVQQEPEVPIEDAHENTPAPIVDQDEQGTASQAVNYWLTPVKSDEEATAEAVIQTLVGQEGIYGFGERTPGRRHIKPGDWICFYATGKGVAAHARVASVPEKRRHPKIRHPDKYNWIVQVRDAHLYLDRPVVIDAALRSQLEAFEGHDPNTSIWAWFVQATRRISKHDFRKPPNQDS